MQQKKDSFGTTFFKNIQSRIFFSLVSQESSHSKGTFSIKLTGEQFRSQMKLGLRIGLVDDYCSDKY